MKSIIVVLLAVFAVGCSKPKMNCYVCYNHNPYTNTNSVETEYCGWTNEAMQKHVAETDKYGKFTIGGTTYYKREMCRIK